MKAILKYNRKQKSLLKYKWKQYSVVLEANLLIDNIVDTILQVFIHRKVNGEVF